MALSHLPTEPAVYYRSLRLGFLARKARVEQAHVFRLCLLLRILGAF